MRRPYRSFAFVLAVLGGGACCRAAELPQGVADTAAALRSGALAGTGAFDLVRSLSHEVGPRLAGSPGDKAAVAWGLAKLRELGFANVRADKVTVPHWERGAEVGEIVTPHPQPVVLAALGGSVGTPEGGITAEVVRFADLAALQAAPEGSLAGKIAFVDNRMQRAQDGSGYGRAVGARGAGPTEAARRGALAFLLRSVGTSNDRIAHTGATRYTEGVTRIPAAALSNPDADLLAARLAGGQPVRFHLELGSRYLPDAESANVIGEIVGRTNPEEIILLGCHLDSWDLGMGAADDGAGCAIVIEAARRIGALERRPRRTVRVVLFANEEFGLSGARAYAERYAADLPRHIVAAESDFGSGKVYRLSSRVAPEALPRVAALAGLLAPLGVTQGDNEAGGGADLIPMAPARVPVLSLDQDGSAYFDIHHTINDTPDKIDPKDLDQNVAVWAVTAYVAAEWPGDFGRAPEPPARR
jgi:carboxypeptidase Q